MLRRLALVGCLVGLAALAAPGAIPARADDAPAEEDEAARKARVEEAKRAKEEEDRQFAVRVNGAIDRGQNWLKAGQMGDGGWPGLTGRSLNVQDLGLNALCVLTLSKCGESATAPCIVRGLRRLREFYDVRPSRGFDFKGSNQLKTYSVATYAMALEAVYGVTPPPAKPGAKPKPPAWLSGEPGTLLRELAAWLAKNQTDDVWRYPGPALGTPVGKDLSNTQYALLALEGAARHGIDVPPAVYEKALPYLLASQAREGPEVVRLLPNPGWVPGLSDQGEEGRYGPFTQGPKDRARGWSYLASLKVYSGSMTCAGIACLAIVKDRLKAAGKLEKDRERRIDRAMLDGLAWLSSQFTVATNPGVGDGGWHYYYLYGLERAGALTGWTHFGKHDWYREGAEYLLGAQTADGFWPEAPARDLNATWQTRTVQTCFALLFLRRATIPPSQPMGPVVTDD